MTAEIQRRFTLFWYWGDAKIARRTVKCQTHPFHQMENRFNEYLNKVSKSEKYFGKVDQLVGIAGQIKNKRKGT